MCEYAAFLRGVNLGPHRRISGADLRSHFEGMGFEDVGTFRASGNAVFGGAIDKLLGSTTRRTKGTMEQLAAKFFAG